MPRETNLWAVVSLGDVRRQFSTDYISPPVAQSPEQYNSTPVMLLSSIPLVFYN